MALVYPQISIKLKRDGDGLTLCGQTDLPNGTLLSFEVAAAGLMGFLRPRRRGRVAARNGWYEISFVPSPWRSAVLDIVVSVRADRTQPTAAQEVLGPEGERLAGEVGGDGYSEYFVSERVRLPG